MRMVPIPERNSNQPTDHNWRNTKDEQGLLIVKCAKCLTIFKLGYRGKCEGKWSKKDERK